MMDFNYYRFTIDPQLPVLTFHTGVVCYLPHKQTKFEPLNLPKSSFITSEPPRPQICRLIMLNLGKSCGPGEAFADSIYSVLSPITQAWSDLRLLAMVALSCAKIGSVSRPNLTQVDPNGQRGFIATRVSMAWCVRRRVWHLDLAVCPGFRLLDTGYVQATKFQ